MVQRRPIAKNHRELQLVLERARTRLAVAIATEAKSTSLDRWRRYFETAERTRRFLKRLREGNADIPYAKQQWTEAAESLKHLPQHAEAEYLCRLLSEILTKVNPDRDF